MNWYTYEVPPIDIGWENMRTVQETASILTTRMHGGASKNDITPSDLQSFLYAWESAKEEASINGCEGDFRNEPVVIWIPNDTEFNYGFAFKQDNNGTTYVVSPVSMPWLESE